MNPDFSDWRQALVRLLHPELPAGADEPISTLGARTDRFDRTVGAIRKDVPMAPAVAAHRAQVEALDQTLIRQLADAGYLPKPPKVKIKAAHRLSQARVSLMLRIAPTIVLSTDDTGRVRPLTPHVQRDAWEARPSQESWSHAGTLLHEAAHCMFSKLERPFQTPRLPAETVEGLNAFLLGPMADARAFFHRALNEAFADVYSAMLLETLAPRNEGMRREVDNLRWVRGFVREHDFDPALNRRALLVSMPHQTDFALALADQHRALWEGQSPEAMIAAAQRFASEGLVTLLSPGRELGPDRTALDERLVNYLGVEMRAFATDGPLVITMAHELSTPGRSRLKTWRRAYPDHPAFPLLDRMQEKLNPQGKPIRDLYPGLDAEQRHGAIALFLERGLKFSGATLREAIETHTVQAAQSLREGLLPMQDESPLPEARVKRRRRPS